jgi:hypothetical protein
MRYILCLIISFFYVSLIKAIQLNQTNLINEFGYSINSNSINLSSRSIDSIEVNTFVGFSNLKVLYLQKNKLSRLTEPIFKSIFNLKEVWLEENNIISLSKDSFVGLVNLEKICLNDNPISSLFPASLATLCSTNPNCEVKITEKCLFYTTTTSTTTTTTIKTTSQSTNQMSTTTTTNKPNVDTFYREALTLINHTAQVNALAYNKNDNLLISGSDSLKLWNLDSAELIDSITNYTFTFSNLAVMPNGYVISGDVQGFVNLWDTRLNNILAQFRPYGVQVNNILVLSERTFAVCFQNFNINIYDSKTTSLVKSLSSGNINAFFTSLAIVKDVYLVAGTTRSEIWKRNCKIRQWWWWYKKFSCISK